MDHSGIGGHVLDGRTSLDGALDPLCPRHSPDSKICARIKSILLHREFLRGRANCLASHKKSRRRCSAARTRGICFGTTPFSAAEALCLAERDMRRAKRAVVLEL